jgi:hypothetical protein
VTVRWDDVKRAEVLRAIQEYDGLGPQQFFPSTVSLRLRHTKECSAIWDSPSARVEAPATNDQVSPRARRSRYCTLVFRRNDCLAVVDLDDHRHRVQ